MRKPPDVAIFVVLVFAWSVLLVALAATLPGIPDFSRSNSLIAIPVASVMLGARGTSWRRKLAYAGLVLGVWVAVDYAFMALGGGAYLVASRGFAPLAWALAVAYALMGLAFPLVMLLLFVRRDPSMLWVKSPKADPATPPEADSDAEG